MERIDASGKPQYNPAKRSRKKIGEKPVGKASFSALVGERERIDGDVFEDLGINSDSTVEEMLDAIYSIGDRVKDNPTLDTIGRYRKAVRSFMRFIVDHAIEVEERHSSPNILKQKKFTLVKVIDQKLDKLASGLLSSQQEAFKVLAGIDEINGLLVNFTR